MSTQYRHSRVDTPSPPAEGSSYAEFVEDQDWHDHETRAMTPLNSTGSPLAATAQNGQVGQISVGQRMLSATGGSILTALLGWLFSLVYQLSYANIILNSHTPRCCANPTAVASITCTKPI